MNRLAQHQGVVVLAVLAVLAGPARADDDPASDGPHPVRAVKLDVVAGGKKTFVDVRLPKDAPGPFPVVLICHGMAASVYNYEGIADHLASRGFAAVLFQQPDRWSNDTAGWARQIKDALDALDGFNADAKSALAGQLDMSRLGLVGHSFGGAAVVWEAASDPRVKCVVGLAPVNQANRAKLMENAGAVKAPLLVVAGDWDWLATNKTYTRAIYDNAKLSAHREYVQVSWGDHNFYTGTSDKSRLASRYYTAWLEQYLGVRADTQGLTDGTAAARDQKAKRFSATAAAAAPPPPSDSPGLVGAITPKPR